MVGRAARAVRWAVVLVLAALLVTTFIQVAPARAETLGDLGVQRTLAIAELEQARAQRRQAWANLADARAAHQRAYLDLQDNAAAMWMGVEPDRVMDAAFLDTLATGVRRARDDLDLATAVVNGARLELTSIDGRLALARSEARRQRAARAYERAARADRQRRSATISCPVAYPSAIYADFGAPRRSGPHRGIDIPAPQGSPALAAWHARVKQVVHGGWMGRGIILQDGAGNTWWYAHLSTIEVAEGQVVARGQQIGLVGSTGNSTGPHLHFEVHARGVTPVDPYSLASPACGVTDPLTPQQRVAHEASTDAAN